LGREIFSNGWKNDTNETPIPAEFGGSTWGQGLYIFDPMILINRGRELNQDTGFYYDPEFWASVGADNKTHLQDLWTAHFNATDPVAYMMENNLFTIIEPSDTNWIMPEDSAEFALMRTELQPIVNNASWQMVFSANEDEFYRLWNEMKALAYEMGWETLFDYDKALAEDMFRHMS
jgi:multiple sugar transport system substrate-binding protein/putative aldouronate transport system substrate-binding protein